MKNSISKNSILTALFAALVCAGSFIHIPLPGGIPVVIQDMMARLAGMILGPLYGSLAVLIFLILGSVGLPVFSGKAGLHVITGGPTGGFLIGYLLGAFIGGLIVHFFYKKDAKAWYLWFIICLSALASTIVVFIAGIIGFCRIFPDKTMSQVLAAVLIPFIPGTIIKFAVSVLLAKKLRPVVQNYIG